MSNALIFPTQNFWNDKNGNNAVDTGEVTSPVLDSAFIQGIINAVTSAAGSSNFFFNPNNPPTVTNGVSIGDKVWLDSNRNGLQDNGETGVANVKVKLYSNFAGLVSETTTDANGNYAFNKVPSTIYYLQFIAPSGHSFTRRDMGLDSYDSEADSNGYTRASWLLNGQTYNSYDAGLVNSQNSAGIGNRVWLDSNGNGKQEANESGVSGVTVNLRDANNQLRSTSTDFNGNYRFEGLAAGQYQVEFISPNGYNFTQADQGGDELDSDAAQNSGRTVLFSLAAGEDLASIDAGLIPSNNRTASIGDRVWLDSNGNGIQDGGEQGVANVDVILMRTDIVYIQAPPEVRVKTDAYGNYKFSNLEAGKYSLKFVLPEGYRFTNPDINNDQIDSDANQQTGLTGEFQLATAEQQVNVDAGLVRLNQPSANAAIGDRIWLDNNRNGLQDQGEAGKAGIKVSLYSNNASFWSAPLATVTTDNNGTYLFEQLTPGRYRIKVDWPGFGYRFADKNTGNNDQIDSDVDTLGYSDYVDLVAGEKLSGVTAGLVSLFNMPWSNTPSNPLPSVNNLLSTNNLLDNIFGTNSNTVSNNNTVATNNTALTSLFPWEM